MKKLFLSSFLILTGCYLYAQSTTKPVFTYGKDTVYNTEFERIYSKNNTSKEKLDEKTIREYLELFINFKLKVKEARKLGLDTAATFKAELEGYKKQLAQPYLMDKEVTQGLINEAYDRMQYEVNASHILIRVTPEDLPKDTLIAYNKIMELRKAIMNGESFDSLAYKFSEDPSAKGSPGSPGYLGNLGYFSAFGVVYPFESVAYKTPVGTVSMPFRTPFGYHILKVIDKRKNKGEVKTAHIMIKPVATGTTPDPDADAKSRIDAIYAKLQKGESFDELVKTFSMDETSSKSGGVLGWFSGTSPNFPPEFKKAAFELQNIGDISKPVKTDYGWHIIKKLEVKETPTLKEVQENIKSRISRDMRSDVNKTAVVERVKKESSFKEYPENLKAMSSLVDSTILTGRWKSPAVASTKDVPKSGAMQVAASPAKSAKKADPLDKVLFTFGNEKFTQRDFATYIEDYQTPKNKGSVPIIISHMYRDFVAATALSYEERHLEEKYPEFKNLVQEYREGILLFDLTDKKVWSKSVNDTAGLEAFHEKNKAKYMWKERTEVVIYDCADKKVAKQVQKLLKKGVSQSDMMKEVNKDKPLNLSVREGKFEKGENSLVDSLNATSPGMYTVNGASRVLLVEVKAILPAQAKTLKEAKGSITADYQAHLEKEWLDKLRSETPVYIFEQNISTLFK